MIERRQQPGVRGLEHAVAEHIAGHVANADSGEVLRLGVDAHFAEVALHALPAAARSDAHLLVVIAGRTAGGEGIAEPEVVIGGETVGDVGEGRRALVGGHHQVRIVAVATDHLRRRDDLAFDDVVGDVEQRRDEGAIALDAFALHLFAAGAGGHALGHEAALGADRDDQRVLDVLRLHQAQHFGTEVFAAIRPANAAASHLAHAQVNAFDARRINKDLEGRPGLRHFGDAA